MSEDETSNQRFKIMERKLYYGIATPSAILATFFGLWLLGYNPSYYLHAGWMQAKLSLVVLLWIYHIICAKYLIDFKYDKNKHSHKFYRWFNEIPVVFLVVIVILVVVK